MRIVSGKYKGRAINPPRNLRARPTTDFAKENLFNVLGNLVDFLFYGQQLRNLASGIGFALMAYGTYRNVQAASTVGLLLAAGSLVAKYFL